MPFVPQAGITGITDRPKTIPSIEDILPSDLLQQTIEHRLNTRFFNVNVYPIITEHLLFSKSSCSMFYGQTPFHFGKLLHITNYISQHCTNSSGRFCIVAVQAADRR